MIDDWHKATISRRDGTYYALMTIPAWAQPAFGQTQLRISARTKDKREAYDKLNDLELRLRAKVLRSVASSTLTEPKSALSRLTKTLHLEDAVFAMRYDPNADDNFEVTFSEIPASDDEVEYAMGTLANAVKNFEDKVEEDAFYLKWYKAHSEAPPDIEEVKLLLGEASRELENLLTSRPQSIKTASDYLEVFEGHLRLTVDNGHMKSKTAKARVNNIKRFIEIVGIKPLADITKADAYRYAAKLSSIHGNSTIKTRISDVSTMLNQAERDGLIVTNPLQNLKLSSYGKKKESYAPLSDFQIRALLEIPGLPARIRDIWIVLAGTGMRLDEAALLTREQVKSEYGIQYFDLRTASVKNNASRRRVPISATLSSTVERLCTEKSVDNRLFDFPIKSDGKSRGSEQCNYWMKKAIAADPDSFKNGHFTTHSLRGSFKDKLRDAGVDSEINNAILGHDLGGMAGIYGRGPSLQSMKSAVDKTIHEYLNQDTIAIKP